MRKNSVLIAAAAALAACGPTTAVVDGSTFTVRGDSVWENDELVQLRCVVESVLAFFCWTRGGPAVAVHEGRVYRMAASSAQ